MFGIYTQNMQNSFQPQFQRVVRPSTQIQTLNFFIGQALQINILMFSCAQKNFVNQSSQVIEIIEYENSQIQDQQLESEKNVLSQKLSNKNHREDNLSNHDQSTSNCSEGKSEEINFKILSRRNSAENLNNSNQKQEQNIIQLSENQEEKNQNEFFELFGAAEVPKGMISIEEIQLKRNELLKRQVSNWKQTYKKQKGQLKRLQN